MARAAQAMARASRPVGLLGFSGRSLAPESLPLGCRCGHPTQRARDTFQILTPTTPRNTASLPARSLVSWKRIDPRQKYDFPQFPRDGLAASRSDQSWPPAEQPGSPTLSGLNDRNNAVGDSRVSLAFFPSRRPFSPSGTEVAPAADLSHAKLTAETVGAYRTLNSETDHGVGSHFARIQRDTPAVLARIAAPSARWRDGVRQPVRRHRLQRDFRNP